jgi:hypothetical protein
MPQPVQTRQVQRLTPEDFLAHPVWEFVPDEELAPGQDEATVRPSAVPEVNDAGGLYVIAADALLNDGTQLPGYVYSGDPDDPAAVQPHLLIAGTQVNFWFGSLRFRAYPEDYLNACYAVLDRDRDAIFPIRFVSRVPVNGAPMTVVVTGFKASDHHDTVFNLG